MEFSELGPRSESGWNDHTTSRGWFMGLWRGGQIEQVEQEEGQGVLQAEDNEGLKRSMGFVRKGTKTNQRYLALSELARAIQR